jgi:hypothetical protein
MQRDPVPCGGILELLGNGKETVRTDGGFYLRGMHRMSLPD